MKLLTLFFVLLLQFAANAQQIKIELNELSKIDKNSVHLVALEKNGKEVLILPAADKEMSTGKKYMSLFYSWDTGEDQNISVLVYQFNDEDLLYIDRNNDEDLTNDGPPILFPLEQDSVSFTINSSQDKNQILKLSLWRKPDLPDSSVARFVNPDGNLNEKYLMLAKVYSSDPVFNGDNRSFYFDYRITVRKSVAEINGVRILLGLFDYTNNGIFNDERDLLLIDFNQDNKLDYLHDEEIFKLNDIFRIGDKNYQLENIDRYGHHLSLQETTTEPTKYYARSDYDPPITPGELTKYKLDSEFWTNSFTDIDGSPVDMNDYKGKYLFINFWGAWCMPCRKELPDLVKAYNKYTSTVEFISFIKSNNLDRERKILSENKARWIQIELPQEMIEKFKIRGYPSNILIFHNGEQFLKTGMVDESFFEKYIK